MPFDDMIGGGPNFTASGVLDNVSSMMLPDLPADASGDMILNRINRKMGGGRRPPQSDSDVVTDGDGSSASSGDAKAPDFSSQGIEASKLPDFSSQGIPVTDVPMPQPRPAAADGSNGPLTYATEFGKGALDASKNMGAAAFKAADAVGIPTVANDAFLEELNAVASMTPAQIAKLRGRAFRGISDRGLQIDYNAALQRIADGADAAKEIGGLRPKFEANNKSATMPVAERPLFKAGQAVEDFGKETLKAKPGFEGSFTRDLGGGLGSLLTGVGVSMIPGIGPAAAGTLFTAAGMGEAADKAVDNKATPQQVRAAATLGGVAGATDMVDALLPMLGSTGRVMGLVKRMGIAAVKGALMEGGQEGVQQLMQNAIAQGIYKPDQDLFEDVPRSVAIAAILGGVGGGLSGAAHSRHETTPVSPQQPGQGQQPGAGPQPGPQPGTGPAGPDPQRSSPEDIADFVRQANESAPPPPPPPPPDPAKMSDGDRIKAFDEARQAFDGASMDDVLRQYGWMQEAIDQMDEQSKINEVIKAGQEKIRGTGKFSSDDSQTKAGPEAQPKQDHSSAKAEPSDELYSTLRAYGYSDEDIENMSPRQREREAKDAVDGGIDPVDAAAKFKRPAAEPQSAARPEPDVTSKKPHQTAGTKPPDGATSFVPQENDDTGQNVPESRATLKAQQNQLIKGERTAQMFPKGTREMPLPPGMERVETPRGVFHFDPKKTSAEAIQAVSAEGRENEILGLGSFSKSDIAARAGERAVTIVERTPDGTEVRAAVGSESTAEQQRDQMEKGKSPGNTVSIETPEQTLDGRNGDGSREKPIDIRMARDVGRAAEAGATDYTPAQGEANNRKLGHAKWNGLPVSLEVSKGGVRKMQNTETGQAVEVTHGGGAYGYFPGTVGADNMHVDVYMGEHPESQHVFVIDEVDRETGSFRQHKVMAGFNTQREAFDAYVGTSSKGPETVGAITPMSVPELKAWLNEGDTKKPLSKRAPSSGAASSEGASLQPGSASPLHGGAAGETKPAVTIKSQPVRSDQPLSLLQFLASKGGLKPNGDLQAMDAHKHRVQIPGRKGFFGLVKTDGLPLDMAREAAEEAGYLRGEHGKTSTERDLLDLIDNELRGQRRYAEGEEDTKTKRDLETEQESSDHARDQEIDAAREQIAAEYRDLPDDVLDAAATAIVDENLDIDSAVEVAAMRLVNEESDYESNDDLAATFGEGFDDEIQRKPASADGEPAAPTVSEEQRSSEGEEAEADGERVPAAGAESTQGEDEDDVATERTEAGEQTILPGAEKIGDGELAQRKTDAGLKPKVAQKPADDGLFGDNMNQRDMLDFSNQVEAKLGDDVEKVAPVDIARAAELMAENPGMEPETAFGQAVILNAVEQGFITEEQAEEAYGPEVKDILESGQERPLGGGIHAAESSAEPGPVSAGGATQAGELSSSGETGEDQAAAEAASGSDAAAVEPPEQPAASGQQAVGDQAGDTVADRAASGDANSADLEALAEPWQDQFAEGEFGAGPASKYTWSKQDKFSVTKLATDAWGTKADGIDWMEGEINTWASDGDPDRFKDLIDGPIQEPIIVVRIGGKTAIWDGNHRVGASLIARRGTIPAIVGTLKNPAAKDTDNAAVAWADAKPGDTLMDGSILVRKGIKRKGEAADLADDVGGTVLLDGANAWAVTRRTDGAVADDAMWWKSLNIFGRKQATEAAGIPEKWSKALWKHIPDDVKAKLIALRGGGRDPSTPSSLINRPEQEDFPNYTTSQLMDTLDDSARVRGMSPDMVKRMRAELERRKKELRDAPTWAEILALLPKDAQGNKDVEFAFRLMSEITGERTPAYRDLTPSQQGELLARLKGDGDTATKEASDGVPLSVPNGDAGAESEAVPASGQGPRTGSVRGAKGARSGEDVSGVDEGRAEGAGRVPETAVGEGSGGAGEGDSVRVSGRHGDEQGRREEGAVQRDPAAKVAGENYRIVPGGLWEDRSPKAKALGNVRAIELANQLIAEGRPATLTEQNDLALYVGWGGLKGVFPDSDGNFAKGFEQVGADVRRILTDEEYETARRSIQYAHYTAEDIITGMWDMVQRLGFKGGRVFEPGMGVGHFAGLMPADIAERTSYSGLELDHVTARIAKLLYPKWGVRRDDFTRTSLPENAFDLVIGNPPFADISIKSDPKYKQGFLLHDYFFAKSLDGVRPGGLLAFVTSAGTMNKLDPSAREYLADRAVFVGAIRLPSNAFKKNAGTEVTTDIVILRKRMPGEEKGAGYNKWTQTAEVTLPGPDGKPMKGQISRYFVENPDMVLGQGDFADKLYEGRYSVKAPAGFDLKAELAKAIENLQPDVMHAGETQQERAEADFETTEKKDGSYYIGKDGKLMQQRAGAGFEVARRGKGVDSGKTANEIERIRGLIPIRDALRATFAADLADDVEAGTKARARLNKAYDTFVAKFGPINKAEIQRQRPSSIQQEAARAKAREEARYAGEHFDEGSFDASRMEGRSLTEIARARKAAREQQGDKYDEGSFDPEEMPDVIRDKRPNIDPFADDQESYRLRAIEHYNEPTGKGSKSAVFFKNIISKDKPPEIKSVNDAALYVLNQKGSLDIDAIGHLVGKSHSEVIESLGNRIFQVPGTKDTWETKEKYLSGNVRKKLSQAKAEAERNPVFRRNVEALEAAQPAPLAPSQIGASLGMPWIPPKVIEQFALEALGLEKIKVGYIAAASSWVASGDTDSIASTSTWGTNRRNATALLLDALNRQNPKIKDPNPEDGKAPILNVVATEAAQEKLKAIRDRFSEWIFSDEKRADQLASLYNENYNNLVVQEFNGDYLTTPGISSDWEWRPHQKRVVARIIQNGNTYVAHAVGAGKTSEMIAAGMEMRRLGLVKKPMYVVPNHMLAQFTKEFYEQYPTARIMVADERQFHTDRRKQFMANVALSDLDAVIITHSSFGMIPVSDEFQDEVTEEALDEYRRALADTPRDHDHRITRGRIENQIERLEQRLSGRSNRKRDAVFTFDEMGVDFLFVDEAHEFRKLDFSTQMSELKGVDPKGSGQSWDLFVKSKLLEKRNPGRNLVLASGTPVTNTMAELYTVSRYMQRAELAERGLSHFDAWAGAFGESVTELEQDAAGGYKSVTRFARFVNVAELSSMVRQVMDVVTSNQLEQYVVRPKLKGGKRIMNLAEKSPDLIMYQQKLTARMQAMKGRGKAKKGDDIMLKVIEDGRHAAIDMRLAGGEKDEEFPSKVDVAIKNVHRLWKQTKAQKFYAVKDGAYDLSKPVNVGPATQMIFSNLGLSGSRGLAIHSYIRAELVRLGIPRNEIALISEIKNHVAKQKLFNDMNEGKVRILIGSTAKMGTGVNAQRRLYAIHNMDPLWFPADDEQRNGRGLRQGNMNPEIEINDYSTKGTYDSVMWGMMEKKARFIQGFFEGDPSLRSMDDLGAASQYEQAKAMTTNDPRLMKLTELRQEFEKANRRKAAFDNEQYSIRQRSAQAKADIDHYSGREAAIEKDIAQRVPLSGDNFTAKIGKKAFDKRVDFGEALLERMDAVATPENAARDKGVVIGEISGFSLVADVQKIADHFSVNLDLHRNGGVQSHVSVGTSGLGAVRSMESIISGFDSDLAHARGKIAEAKKFIADAEAKKGQKFTGGDSIAELAGQIRELQADLAKSEAEKPMAALARNAEWTTAAKAKQPQIEAQLTKIIRGVVGDAVDIMFHDGLIEIAPEKTSGGWGNLAAGRARGLYYPISRIIKLALSGTARDMGSTAFHESYHGLELLLMNDAELALMERETARLRKIVQEQEGYTDEQIAELNGEEIRAIAFENDTIQRATGETRTGEKPHVGMRRLWDRIRGFLAKIRNALNGLGFRSYEDIFRDAREGKFKDRRPREEGDLEEPLAAMSRGPRGQPHMNETISEILGERNLPRLARISRALGLGKINMTELRTQVQDKFIRIRNAEQSVDGPVPASQSAYQAESLYYGRAGEQLEELERESLDPLITDMKARDIGLEDMNEYLYAKHAPERNRAMDEINHPNMMGGRDLRGRGSGMSDDEAQEVMDRITAAGKMADYEAIEARVRAIIEATRDRLVTSGLLSQDAADAWAAKYEFYVPLRGFEEGTGEPDFTGQGQGFDTRAGESKQAFGRLSRADGPLAYIMQQAEAAIVRAEKNKVGNAWLRFVRSHPDPTRWSVDTPPLKKVIDKSTGLVTQVEDQSWYLKPDVFVTKVGGRPVLIRVHTPDGIKIVRALRNMGTSNLNSVLRFMHTLTTTMSRLSTQWNPNFVLPNLFRDFGESLLNMQAQDQKNFVKQFSKHLFPSIKGAFNALRGAHGGRYGDAFREFDKAGGRIRFFGLESHDDIEKNINRRLRRLEGGVINTAREAASSAGDALEVVNGALENATRLAAYMASRDVGMSIQDSAMLARNLTVDFNKKGEMGSSLNALYMFINASIQGSVRISRALKNKNVRRAVYGLAAIGALGALFNFAAGGDDDAGEDNYSKIPPWVRDKNIVVMWPKGFGHDGAYAKIPLPFGFSPLHVLGDRLTSVFLGKEKPTDAAWSVLVSIAEAFNPLGEESSVFGSFLPSVMRPGMHIATNQNWNGNPLYPDNKFNVHKPDSEQSFKSNSAFSKEAARDINKATGGSSYKSGWADWHPGSIDHVLESLTGGLGKFVGDIVTTGGAIYRGDSFDANHAPIIRRFVGTTNDAKTDQMLYYREREEAKKNGGSAIKQARKDRANGINKEDATEFLKNNTNSIRGEDIFKRADSQMKPLRERMERVKALTDIDDKSRRERIDAITTHMREIQNKARKQYRELNRGN